ncbi:hypothetical protein J437_LFUL014388 [Ladona fulva]|uniref:EGF-like domain-containing protein n=1 Tax=Ladona fulva TaxID=123851 RepID=A0A8K0KK32_LADFU|nr:hypothetical protein J437_LFUL014388 [Ladona fulva]
MPRKVVLVAKLFFLLTVVFLQVVEACEVTERRFGCRIENRRCLCGNGCPYEYRYTSKQECRNAVKGNGLDICSRRPCYNQGSCIQTSATPGYRCRCEGTGFYGNRCELACPAADRSSGSYPYECIVI